MSSRRISSETSEASLKRSIRYLRVSSKKQMDTDFEVDPEGNSIDTQRKVTSAKERDMELVNVGEYVEPGNSAQTIDKRPVFREMIARIQRERDVDYVIVYMMSRAFRNAHDELVTRMMLRKLGVTLVSAKENFGTGYLADAGSSSPPGLAGPVSAARNSSATAGSEFSSPAALVSFSSVMIPVSGSAAACARYPSRRAPGDLRVCRASASTVEMVRSSATLRAIRHRPPVPSEPPAGSTSCPATRASSPSADAAGSSRSRPCSAATTAFASLTSADTRASFAAGSSQSMPGLPGLL